MFRNRFLGSSWPILAFVGVLAITLLFPGAVRSSAGGLFQTDGPQPGAPEVAVNPADSPLAPKLQPKAATGSNSVWLPLITGSGPPRKVWLPLIQGTKPQRSDRLGLSLVTGSLSQYPEATTLKAGWYLDWKVQVAPQRPDLIEYAQMVRLHQNLTCPLWSLNAWDRSKCPYASPPSYRFWPSADVITQAARANPGSLWLIGNEMDRRDWQGGGQDEILPELYATAYHELYTLIKRADPTARLAIGGIIQATPLRLEYLTRVWNAYQQQFGTSMPVDVWNVHNFIFREVAHSYGADIPPGSSAQTGALYTDAEHTNMAIFDRQIRNFRAWMRDRGQQDKPLIVSEYGVVYAHIAEADTAQEVQDFMIKTFDYFLNTQDCSLGYAADKCRLVQRWNWYSFDDNEQSNGFNKFSNLFDPLTFQITSTGRRFREYSLMNIDALGQ